MKKETCLLLIHGFGGNIGDVRPLAEILQKQGLPVFLAEIAGHGEDVKTIESLSYHVWVNSVRELVNKLSETYSVIPVGFSMGGLIAAILNSETQFAGIAFVNTPIYFWNLPQVARNFISDFSTARKRYLKSAGQFTPYAMLQFLRLLTKARGCFSQVEGSVLVVQASDDDTVWPSSAGFICRKARRKAALYIAKSGGHPVLSNPTECSAIALKIINLYEGLTVD